MNLNALVASLSEEERYELLNESFDGVTPGSGMAKVCQK